MQVSFYYFAIEITKIVVMYKKINNLTSNFDSR